MKKQVKTVTFGDLVKNTIDDYIKEKDILKKGAKLSSNKLKNTKKLQKLIKDTQKKQKELLELKNKEIKNLKITI